MKKHNLNTAKGFPSYLLHSRNKTVFETNFLTLEHPAQVGDQYQIGDHIFTIEQMKETRVSELEYGVEQDVHWHSVVSKLTGRQIIQDGMATDVTIEQFEAILKAKEAAEKAEKQKKESPLKNLGRSW